MKIRKPSKNVYQVARDKYPKLQRPGLDKFWNHLHKGDTEVLKRRKRNRMELKMILVTTLGAGKKKKREAARKIKKILQQRKYK